MCMAGPAHPPSPHAPSPQPVPRHCHYRLCTLPLPELPLGECDASLSNPRMLGLGEGGGGSRKARWGFPVCPSNSASSPTGASYSLPWALTEMSLQAQPGWSSVCRARRTWPTWTTGPTRRGARRTKTPASSRSLPTATLVGTPPWARSHSNPLLLSLVLPLHSPVLLSLSVFHSFSHLCGLCVSFIFFFYLYTSSTFWHLCPALSHTLWSLLWMSFPWCLPPSCPTQGCFL